MYRSAITTYYVLTAVSMKHVTFPVIRRVGYLRGYRGREDGPGLTSSRSIIPLSRPRPLDCQASFRHLHLLYTISSRKSNTYPHNLAIMSATSTIQAKVSPHIDTSAVTDAAAKAVKPMLTGSVLRPSTSGSVAPPALPLFQRLLARYLNNLAVKPLKTKAVTSGILFFLQEVIAARASGSPKEDWPAKNSNLRRVAPPQLLGLLSQLGVSSKAIQVGSLSIRSLRSGDMTLRPNRRRFTDVRLRRSSLGSPCPLLRRVLPKDVCRENRGSRSVGTNCCDDVDSSEWLKQGC
jgi:hypothetical protein